MDPLPEHGFIESDWDEQSQQVFDRLRRNDPTLKELTLLLSIECSQQMFLQAFDAIATNSSLKTLNIKGGVGFLLIFIEVKDRATRALSLNTSLTHISITPTMWWRRVIGVIDIIMVSPNLEALTIQSSTFYGRSYHFDDDSAVSTVRTLCRKRLKNLSLVGNGISRHGYERIIQVLKENEHSFIKLDLFQDSQYSPLQNKIQLEIDMLTWNNCLQVEKDTWVNLFLEQDAPSKELLFFALERAKKVDNERSSKAPNMLFYLIKETPDLIVQAIRDWH